MMKWKKNEVIVLSRLIGVIDLGVGGLMVVKEIMR